MAKRKDGDDLDVPKRGCFSRPSQSRLATCHLLLQRVFESVVWGYPCEVLRGHVDATEQARAIAEGRSDIPFPLGPHNAYPSLSVDVVPWGLDLATSSQETISRLNHFGGYVRGVAEMLRARIRWAGFPYRPGLTVHDLAHYELDLTGVA